MSGITVNGANASERLALTRLLGLARSEIVGRDRFCSAVRNLAAASEAYESVWLVPRAGRLGEFPSHPPSRRAACRRRSSPTTTSLVGGCGRGWWTGGCSGLALEGSAAVFVKCSVGALRRTSAQLSGRSSAPQPAADGAPRRGGDPSVSSRTAMSSARQDPRGYWFSRCRAAASPMGGRSRRGTRRPCLARARPGNRSTAGSPPD